MYCKCLCMCLFMASDSNQPGHHCIKFTVQLLYKGQYGSYLTCTESTSPAVAFCCVSVCICLSVTM